MTGLLNDTEYHYDRVGSFKMVDDGRLADYAVNSLNQFISINGYNTYEYDLNGNMTEDGMYSYL